MKEQWQKIVELKKRSPLPCGNPESWDQLTLTWLKSADGQAFCKLLRESYNSAPDMARRLLAIEKIEPQIRLIVETVNPGLARELRELLGGGK